MHKEVQPEALHPEAVQAEAVQAEAVQAEAVQVEAVQVEAVQPEAVQVEAVQAEAVQPEAVQLEAVQLEALQPEAVQPEAVQPEAVQPEAVQPQIVQPQAVQPEITQSELVQPGVVQPEAVDENIPLPVISEFETALETPTRKPAGQLDITGSGSQAISQPLPGVANDDSLPVVPTASVSSVTIPSAAAGLDQVPVTANPLILLPTIDNTTELTNDNENQLKENYILPTEAEALGDTTTASSNTTTTTENDDVPAIMSIDNTDAEQHDVPAIMQLNNTDKESPNQPKVMILNTTSATEELPSFDSDKVISDAVTDMRVSNKVARVAEVTAGLATQVDKVSTTPLDYYDPMAIAIRMKQKNELRTEILSLLDDLDRAIPDEHS